MRKLFCFILLLTIHVQGFAIGRDTLYHKAYQEICAMLDGQTPLSIKRAWNENNLQPKDVQILTKEQYEEIIKKK